MENKCVPSKIDRNIAKLTPQETKKDITKLMTDNVSVPNIIYWQSY
jgi:hypothetical protein